MEVSLGCGVMEGPRPIATLNLTLMYGIGQTIRGEWEGCRIDRLRNSHKASSIENMIHRVE